MTREQFAVWLDSFCRSWETLDTEAYIGLFTDAAAFHEAPYVEPEVGRAQLIAGWDSLKAFQTGNRMDYEILAVEGDMGICHWWASYANSGTGVFRELDGILVLEFASDGRCRKLREWRHARDDGEPVPT